MPRARVARPPHHAASRIPARSGLGLALCLAALGACDGGRPPAVARPPDGAPLYPVDYVIDGDTLVVDLGEARETVRLIGIDAPETGDGRTQLECFGREAREEARRLLSGRQVRLATDPSQDTRDRYDRLLAYVWLEDGTFVNLAMVETGYAFEYTYDLPYRYQPELRAAGEHAMASGAGLWAPGACDETGWP